jgi:hypothetical protein
MRRRLVPSAALMGGAALLMTLVGSAGACTLLSGVASLREVDGSSDGGATRPSEAAVDATQRDASGDTLVPIDARSDIVDSRPTDAPTDAGPMLIFDEEFEGGTLNTTTKWTASGDGVWSIEDGHGVQSRVTPSDMLYATSFGAATNYHIYSRMRSTGPFDAGLDLAPEIVFRVEPGVDASGLPANFRCNMDLSVDELLIQQTPGGSTALKGFTLPSGFDRSTPFVLDALVDGDTVTCTVTMDTLGVLASVMTSAVTVPSGSFGLKTYDTTAEYEYFRVYAVP